MRRLPHLEIFLITWEINVAFQNNTIFPTGLFIRVARSIPIIFKANTALSFFFFPNLELIMHINGTDFVSLYFYDSSTL